MRSRSALVALVAGAVLAACAQPAADACVDWKADVAPALADGCAGCHDEATAEGNYRVDTYLAALGGGADAVPNVVAGDGGSRLLTVLRDAPASDPHAGHDDTLELLRRWVVDCRVAWYLQSPHDPGILNPADQEQFHTRRVEAARYDLSVCADCHGPTLEGGRGGACSACHAAPMTSCAACHANLSSGAHADHLQSALSPGWCGACHVVPRGLLDPGHVLTADGEVDPPPAEVSFAAVASRGIGGGGAAWDPATGTCTVYCHGDSLGDAARTPRAMAWSGGAGGGDCRSCHGMPPASHSSQEHCGTCHGLNAGDAFDATWHLDGAISLGAAPACNGCHGGGQWGMPPPDLSGSRDTTSLGVGAHATHKAPPALRGPIPCDACHQMPAAVGDAGHVDRWTPAEVFPPAIAATSEAFARGAAPAWDPVARTCNDYCHGNNDILAVDRSAGLNREPDWTAVGQGEVVCGSCHGIPPDDGFHNQSLQRTQCMNCHAATVDPAGDIIVDSGGNSTHIDGDLDL